MLKEHPKVLPRSKTEVEVVVKHEVNLTGSTVLSNINRIDNDKII